MDSPRPAKRVPLSSIGYRPALDSPGIGRAHDMQRLLSYGVSIVAGIVLDLPSWQTAGLVVIGLALFIAALYRLARAKVVAPYVLAQADHAVAGTAIAIATASPIITFAAGVFIAGAIAATFDAPRALAIKLGLLWMLPQITLALVIGGGEVAPYASVVALTTLLTALAIVILIFFGVQARKLQQKLRRREDQLNAVLATTPVLLATVSQSGSITALTGTAGSDGPAFSARDLAASPEVRQVIADTRRRGRVRREVAASGRVLSVTCHPGVEGTLLLTAYDITSQAQARDHLRQMVKSKDQFIAAVSHELRTPLSSVLGFSELIYETTGDNDELHPLVGEIVSQSAEMAAIIEDLLVAARSSFEQIATAPRTIDLNVEVVSVVDSIRHRLTGAPDCDTSAAVPAFADPIRVRQIIRNLVTNADRYGGDHIFVTTSVDGDDAVVAVRDSGSAIPAELQERIFEPYESSGPVGGQPAAIGLGLSVSRTLAELMGGSLTYQHDQQWSTFELRLPSRDPSVSEQQPEIASQLR